MSIRHIVRNASMALFRYSGAAFLYRLMALRRGPLVRVVVFHDIEDSAWFASLMETMRNRYHLISPEEFVGGRFKEDGINVLVTFDDGYESWVSQALPILERLEVKGLFFINSGLLDGAENEDATKAFMENELMISPRAPLTWAGAAELSSRGHTIGSHARHHYDLTRLSSDAVFEELGEDKRRIEEKLRIKVTECAYPFGTFAHVNSAVMEAARACGFERGYTAISRFASPAETFRIPRMCIESSMRAHDIPLWIEGSYDLFDMVKSVCVR